MNYRSLLKLIL